MALRKIAKKQEAKEPKITFGILRQPCVTEKSTRLSQANFYTFKISRDCNKKDVKEAVESRYKVEVEKVRIVNLPRKKRFSGRKISGFVSGCKKAMVKLKEGQTIEVTGK
jgi:large subunit ribosomal protein L23